MTTPTALAKKPAETRIRKEWPRVTWKDTRTGGGWNIDARRAGTSGKEEFRADRKKALARAAEIVAECGANITGANSGAGQQAVSLPIVPATRDCRQHS